MNLLYLLVCLINITFLSSLPIIMQSSPSTTILFPINTTVSTRTHFNNISGSIIGPAVTWIQNSKPTPGLTIYQTEFYVSCNGPLTLRITAASSFSASIDGTFVGSGSNYSQIYIFKPNISLGSHNFKVAVVSQTATSALIFSMDQNQSSCYQCKPTGYWNEASGRCECINTLNDCGCPSPKVWKDYPICGCGCRSGPGGSGVGGLVSECARPKYFNLGSCSCTCHHQYCSPGYSFNIHSCTCLPNK